MSDQLMFVQFPHPGPEHRPMGDFMDWNRRTHARKFLQATGTYVRGGSPHRGSFVFWGEWEPQSLVTDVHRPDSAAHPHWLHEPVWEVPRHRQMLQNTDPLVFGDRFLYSNCRQGAIGKLRELAPGSIVVFGSKVSEIWVVDTVFVVGDASQPFTGSAADSVDCSDWIRAVVFDPLQMSSKKKDGYYRAYSGRSYEDAPAGPFSFVPCRPFVGRPPTFPRPSMRLPSRWMTPNLAQGAKASPASKEELEDLWQELVAQTVELPGLAMGVRLDPPRQLAEAV